MPERRPSRILTQPPLILSLVLLFLIIVVPLGVQRRVERLRGILAAAEPARLRVSGIQLFLAREMAATRGFLLTEDTANINSRLTAQRLRNRAHAELLLYADRLGPGVKAEVQRLQQLGRVYDPTADSLFQGLLSKDQYIARMPTQESRYDAIIASAAQVDEEIGHVVTAVNHDAATLERRNTFVVVVLAALSIIGALLVARLGRNYRKLADRLGRRSQWREAVNEAARDLGAAMTPQQAADAATWRVLEATRAQGAYIELVGEDGPEGDVEVISVAGEGCPPVHVRVQYPGSLSREVVQSRERLIFREVDAIGEKMAPYLRETCRDCAGVVLPLRAEDRLIGALVLLRSREGTPFEMDEIDYIRPISDLIAAAIRRVRLLDQVTRTRDMLVNLLESMQEAFYALDSEERFKYVNREAERVLTTAREDLLGRVIWDVFPDLKQTEVYEHYMRALRRHELVEFIQFFRPIGIWADIRIYPAPDGVSILLQDITEQHRMENALRESEQNFRALGNTIPQLAWMADSDGNPMWLNQRWYEFSGTDPQTFEMNQWAEFIHPDHRDPVLRRFEHSVRSGKPWEETFLVRSRTGEYRWFLSRAMPIRNEKGRITRWFGTDTDITDQMNLAREREELLRRERQARKEAEQRRAELARATESRAILMRGFGHDVKNPLGAADGYLQLMEDGILGELDERQLESVRTIRRSVLTAVALIEDVLTLARAEAGQIQIQRSSTDVCDVVRKSIDEYRAKAESKGLTLDIEVTEPVPLLDTDPQRVQQVIGNLLSNAVKYTAHGGVTVSIHNRDGDNAPGRGHWIAIDVCDTGPGISEDQQQTIFNEFSRVRDTTSESGAGIGLAIAQRIAHALRGDISLRSKPAAGSTFSLWLPVP